MIVSVVSTLYCSSPYIQEFYERASRAASQVAGENYEIILVNDGSPDDSLAQAITLSQVDRHVVVVDLSRNFGHHKAMMAGLEHSCGELVFLIDSDLEESPEWLLPFYAQLERDKADVVYGIQESRKGKMFERVSGFFFYRIFRLLTGLPLPNNVVVSRLMTRRYVNALLRHQESELFLAGLWVITGFLQLPQKVCKISKSKSTYTLDKKLAQFIDSITAFSSAPLIGIFSFGCAIFFTTLAVSCYLVFNWVVAERPPDGYTSLMVSIWLLGGLVIAFQGILGLYLAKVYNESKRRPITIVREVFRN